MAKARVWRKTLILVFLIFFSFCPAASISGDQLHEGDRILSGPTLTLGQAQQALAFYEAALAGVPRDEEPLLTRLARVCFILGDMAPETLREDYYDQGLKYAERLLREQPGGVAGHYWKAMNEAGLADTGGKLRGRKLLPDIMDELRRSLALDEAYDHAGAHRVLGRIYYEAPRPPFSVGDLQKSLTHLTAAVRLAPDTSTNHLYLAETLMRLGETTQARQELERVLTSSHHAVQPGGLAEDRREARRLLEGLSGD